MLRFAHWSCQRRVMVAPVLHTIQRYCHDGNTTGSSSSNPCTPASNASATGTRFCRRTTNHPPPPLTSHNRGSGATCTASPLPDCAAAAAAAAPPPVAHDPADAGREPATAVEEGATTGAEEKAPAAISPESDPTRCNDDDQGTRRHDTTRKDDTKPAQTRTAHGTDARHHGPNQTRDPAAKDSHGGGPSSGGAASGATAPPPRPSSIDPSPAAPSATPRVRGFEGFYAPALVDKVAIRRHRDESVQRAYLMSPAERILTVQLARRARARRTLRRAGAGAAALAAVWGYQRWRSGRRRRAELPPPGAMGRVEIDVAAHRVCYYDADHDGGAPRAVRSFLDYDALVESLPATSDLRVVVHTYYPWLPVMLLALLPVAAAVARHMRVLTKEMLAQQHHSDYGWSSSVGVSGRRGGVGVGVGVGAAAASSTRFRFERELSVPTRLSDVAGLTEAKKEVTEVIDFLVAPARYRALGARLPKGVLLDGPPGVGKTLLARAVAGEAAVPFLSCSGSEFDEVYVGVGAQRVRELFREAHRCKPCVVFIDEVDAVGRRRQSGGGGGGSRATLNAFLSEMDGFKDATGIIVLAATNRADVLDKALTRSGRFDRKLTLDLPSYADRVAIARVHLRPLRLDTRWGTVTREDYATAVAALTPGRSGADIFNICNEAAIVAARELAGGAAAAAAVANRADAVVDAVSVRHVSRAAERVLVGLERRAVRFAPHEKERLAYHAAGAVVVNWFLPHTDPVLQVTILPRGRRRHGVVQRLPQQRFILTEEQLLDEVVGQLGGLVAEEYFFAGDVSSRAAQELRQATATARRMVCVYGMDPHGVGHVHYADEDDSEGGGTAGWHKAFGPAQEERIDASVEGVVRRCLARARAMLRERRASVRAVAAALMAQETLTARELQGWLGDRPHMSREFVEYLTSTANETTHGGGGEGGAIKLVDDRKGV